MRLLSYFLISALAHFLAARWILAVFPRTRARRREVFAAAAVLSLGLVTLHALDRQFGGPRYVAALALVMIELAIVVISLVPLGIVAITSRAATRVLAAVKPPIDSAEVETRISRREAVERTLGVAVVGASGLALGWGAVVGRHAFQLEEVVIKVKNWPRALDGYVIAQVSDIHVGAYVRDRELDEGFELVRRIRPDLLVATGDLVDVECDALGPLVTRLAGAGARDGAYAVLGNHDHYAGAAAMVDLLRASKVRLLDNEGVHLRPGDGGGFALLGVDDLQGRRGRSPAHMGPDLGRALAAVPPDLPRILLAHQPRFFLESQGRVSVQLSGHTHGGQINPGFRPAGALFEFVAGRYERAGSTLWVNRGFGVVGPPARLGAAPEVTKIVIVAA